MPWMLMILITLNGAALASDHGSSPEAAAAHSGESAPAVSAAENSHGSPDAVKPGPKAVVAIDSKSGKPIHVDNLVESGASVRTLVDRANTRIELAPHSIAEFRETDGFRLLRGSACLLSRGEGVARTSSAKVDFTGRVLLSYDYKEKSTSAFVLEGQARIVNAFDEKNSLRLDRFHGASMLVGDVIPQLVRQLDLGAVSSWMAGYAWPAEKREEYLSALPSGAIVAGTGIPVHLEQTKLEEYFSSVEAEDDAQGPDYYARKFDDPDKVIAEANVKKADTKVLKPEEAALISLPSTKIDLGFELGVVSEKQRDAEINAQLEGKKPGRGIASISTPKAKPRKMAAAVVPVPEQGDREIAATLQRLRGLRGEEAQVPVPKGPVKNTRAPASEGSSPVPDTVYDFSQNF